MMSSFHIMCKALSKSSSSAHPLSRDGSLEETPKQRYRKARARFVSSGKRLLPPGTNEVYHSLKCATHARLYLLLIEILDRKVLASHKSAGKKIFRTGH